MNGLILTYRMYGLGLARITSAVGREESGVGAPGVPAGVLSISVVCI
ncbi:MAG: hypothetical protein ABFD49_05525 [Armatimonadota bacterium]|nr:hypothetical protein [bacterium]